MTSPKAGWPASALRQTVLDAPICVAATGPDRFTAQRLIELLRSHGIRCVGGYAFGEGWGAYVAARDVAAAAAVLDAFGPGNERGKW